MNKIDLGRDLALIFIILNCDYINNAFQSFRAGSLNILTVNKNKTRYVSAMFKTEEHYHIDSLAHQ